MLRRIPLPLPHVPLRFTAARPPFKKGGEDLCADRQFAAKLISMGSISICLTKVVKKDILIDREALPVDG